MSDIKPEELPKIKAWIKGLPKKKVRKMLLNCIEELGMHEAVSYRVRETIYFAGEKPGKEGVYWKTNGESIAT